MKTEEIYVVSTEADVEGRSSRVLGYVMGNPDDVRAYFDDRKYYKLTLEKALLVHLTAEDVSERKALLERKAKLRGELGALEAELNALDGGD